MAQRLIHEVSMKFIPLASKKDVILDTMVGLKKLNNTIRWKEYWRTKRKIKRLNNCLDTGKAPESETDDKIDLDGKFCFIPGREGLKSDILPLNRPQAPKASVKVEKFLSDVERSMLAIVQGHLKDPEDVESAQSKDVRDFLFHLSKSSKVCVQQTKPIDIY